MTKPNQTKPEIDPIGCMIAQRITSALCGRLLSKGAHLTEYGEVADIVYGEISDIVNEQQIGDWIETPNGSTYRLESKFIPNKIS